MALINSSTYIIAEAGINHNGSFEMAKQLIDAAAIAGVDAIKFQTFKAEQIVNKNAKKAEYQKKTTERLETQLEMLKRLELDDDAHKELVHYCKKRGIQFLSTPFDLSSVNLLAVELNLPRIKIPSGEITNGPLLLKVAKTGKPIILSTGMSTLGEIEIALGVLAFGYIKQENSPSLKAFQEAYYAYEGQKALQKNVTLLHCTTEYPAPYDEVNLRAIDTLKASFGLPVGYSDHTVGISIPIASVARGAVIIEKHFTMDRNLPGPDHKASLEPEELKSMVISIRQVEKALGSSLKFPSISEIKNKTVTRKSIVAAKNIKEGELFSEENLTCKRPGIGIIPNRYWELLGSTAKKNFEPDETISD